MVTAGKEFSRLMKAQRTAFAGKSPSPPVDYPEKALNAAVLSAWAYVAGTLHNNSVRLQRHFGLAETAGRDPLNAGALARGRHRTDPDNYRGLGYRTDLKERGRLVELFGLQAEEGKGITIPPWTLQLKNTTPSKHNWKDRKLKRRWANLSAIDDFAASLLEEAKRFLENARSASDIETQAAFLHAALMLGFCALEAHVNATCDEFAGRPELSMHERAILLEQDVRFELGEFKPGGLKMISIQDRILFLHLRFGGKPLDRSAPWWGSRRAP